MAIAVIQTTSVGLASPGASASVTFGTSPTVGNHIIVTAGCQFPGVPGVINFSDNQGNSYNLDLRVASGGNGHDTAVLGSGKVATSAGSFTVNISVSAASFVMISATEVSGLDPTSWLDAPTRGSGSGGTGANVANVTAATATAQANEIVFAVTTVGGSSASMGFTIPAGYTEVLVSQNATLNDVGEGAYQILGSISTPSAAWNHASAFTGFGWAAALASYKAAGGSTTAVKSQAVRGWSWPV